MEENEPPPIEAPMPPTPPPNGGPPTPPPNGAPHIQCESLAKHLLASLVLLSFSLEHALRIGDLHTRDKTSKKEVEIARNKRSRNHK
jgi:hypothetical protein